MVVQKRKTKKKPRPAKCRNLQVFKWTANKKKAALLLSMGGYTIEKVAKELGETYVNSLMGRRPMSFTELPEVQGCQCYNVQDMIYGREVINQREPYKCLCNMSSYGVRPAPVMGCGCYNVEDISSGFLREYKDQSGASCRNYQENIMDMANNELKQMSDNLDRLTQEQLDKMDEFIKRKAYNEAKQKELKTIKEILEN
jgi:hypothetical protein